MADEAKIENAPEAKIDEVKVDDAPENDDTPDDPKITHIIKALKDAKKEEYSLQASDEEIKEKKQKAKKQARDIEINTLKLAFGKVLEQDAAATLEDPLEAEALNKGFEFARIIGELLTAPPGLEAKLDIYAYYKVGINQEPKKPGMFDIKGKTTYGRWEKYKHNSQVKGQQLYIETINAAIGEHGLRE